MKRETYKLEAIAEDMGASPLSRTVEVQIDVVDRSNKPPVWDQVVYGPIYVKENTAVGETVTTVKARSVFEWGKIRGWKKTEIRKKQQNHQDKTLGIACTTH